MKLMFMTLAVLTLASCVTNIDSSKLVLREPNDSAVIKTLTQRHELRIDADRMLIYNNEEKFRVPTDQLVVFESNGSEEPTFTLLEKGGRHFNLEF